ncbi:hypothetical protein [Aromatoleum diolicum]|uniref:Uncharacterized protein n=1 Tax=Aromatoleum diolicum TaxID=75796 RepID=A0ABX1Q6B2_9RHOO|nr:hypothetical protein [Aromatoleum diolicum]NMG73848.1 hypothetical protein [Aromatoleum diolicum]
MAPKPRSIPQHAHGHHNHHDHQTHAALAPAFPGTALVLGVNARVALAAAAAALLWITVGWAIA